jgi:hypothetical protein
MSVQKLCVNNVFLLHLTTDNAAVKKVISLVGDVRGFPLGISQFPTVNYQLEGCSSGFLPIVCGKYQLPTCL